MKLMPILVIVVLGNAVSAVFGQIAVIPGNGIVRDEVPEVAQRGDLTRNMPGKTTARRHSRAADQDAVQALRDIAASQSASQSGPDARRVAEAAGASTAASSDEASGSGNRGALGEVIVTAQKYRQRAFDVPISMAVIGGPDLQQLGITNLENLQFYVPGMYMDNEGFAQFIEIRGISNFFGTGALVGTYLDDADVTSESSFGLDLNSYDLARVEVLKGPQGTLYGEGSLGGTVRYITNKPVLDRFQLGADVTALFDQYGAPGDRVNAVINVPVVAGKLGLRIAADLDHEGGWIDEPEANQKNVNSRNLTDVRIEARWRPIADVTIDGTEVIHRDTSGPFIGENPPGIYTQVLGQITVPGVIDNYNISNVTFNWDPGLVSVVNAATYFVHTNTSIDLGLSFPFSPPPLPATEEYFSGPVVNESLSDELRISGAATGRWRWTVGGFYKRLDDDVLPSLYYFGVASPPGTPLPPNPFLSFGDIYSSAKSMFGDANVRVIGRLVVGAGVRYFKDNENALLVGDAGRERATFTSTDPRFYARYGISRDVNVYAGAAKGFRSGGFNGLGFPQYQPEHVWTYELGTKMRLFDDRLSLDADVFLSNYAGYQIIGVVPPQFYDVTSNAGTARIKGVEADATWNPANGWRLGLSGDYTNARFVSIGATSSDYNLGDPLSYVPRYQVAASARRDFQWRGRAAFARIDYTQRARAPFRDRAAGPWYYSESDYMYLLGFHTGINWRSNLQLGFFAQNLLNVRGYTGADSVETFAPREQPRTFGVNFNVKLE